MRGVTCGISIILVMCSAAAMGQSDQEKVTNCLKACPENDLACMKQCEKLAHELFCTNTCGPKPASVEEWAQQQCKDFQSVPMKNVCIGGKLLQVQSCLPCWGIEPMPTPIFESTPPPEIESPVAPLPPLREEPERTHTRASRQSCNNELALGLKGNSGRSSFLTGTAEVKACRDKDKTRLTLEGKSDVFREKGQNTISRDIKANYEYRFARHWYATMWSSDYANRNYGIDFRVVAAPGIGIELRPAWGLLRVEGGITRTWQNQQGQGSTSFPEGWAGSRIFWARGDDFELTEDLDLLGKTGNWRDHRWESETEIEWRITDVIRFRQTLSLTWDNVPAPNYPKTSVITGTSLGFRWHRR